MKASRSGLLLLLVGLAACQPPVERPAVPVEPERQAPAPSPPAQAEEPAQVSTLAGEWRVAGIDGRSFDEPTGLALTGDDAQLWWQPRCAGVARTYRIEGRRITFGSTEPPRAAGEPTPPVCAIGLPPRLNEVVGALDDAVSIERTANNGVLISGPSHSLTLFSQ
jgi:hypothetical protein